MTLGQEPKSQEKFPTEEGAQQAPQAQQQMGVSGIGLMVQVTNLAWNLVTPIVGGVLLGHYLDNRTGDNFTWTLSLLVLGILIAFMNLYELNVEHRLQPSEGEKTGKTDKAVHDEEK